MYVTRVRKHNILLTINSYNVFKAEFRQIFYSLVESTKSSTRVLFFLSFLHVQN